MSHIYDKHKVNYHSNGVGVYNVQKRLKNIFVEKNGLRIENLQDGGSCVTMKFMKGMVAKEWP